MLLRADTYIVSHPQFTWNVLFAMLFDMIFCSEFVLRDILRRENSYCNSFLTTIVRTRLVLTRLLWDRVVGSGVE